MRMTKQVIIASDYLSFHFTVIENAVSDYSVNNMEVFPFSALFPGMIFDFLTFGRG